MRSPNWMRAVALAAGIQVFLVSTFADGCFVFRWDKKADINEPTQKAIILHNAGREDLLLQVKFDGPVEEFGWLIPVPSLPHVERGSMEAFYELSQLTQRAFGQGARTMTMGGGMKGETEEPARVKVVETKTVGAYRVSVLSANDAGGLEAWLKENGYSIPGGKGGRDVADDYIRRGWFFVATKIDLAGGTEFKVVPAKGESSPAGQQARRATQQKLRSGELHPLLISFDTDTCVFPLKISSVSGKPSEVSLYVLSEKPLLNRFIFEEARRNLEKERATWERGKVERATNSWRVLENSRVLQMQWMLYSEGNRTRSALEDLQAMARESAPIAREESIDEEFYGGGDLLQCILAKPDQIAKSARGLPRLRNKSWYITKCARTFSGPEMRDLEFEPAIPVLTETLSDPIGQAAAFNLARLGGEGAFALIESCRSSDSTTRANAAKGLQWVKDSRTIEPLVTLLADKAPAVRLHAARAAANNWDGRFVRPMIELFGDTHQEIRAEAIGSLSFHEGRGEASKYAAMANDPNPNLRMSALEVLVQLSPETLPREPLLNMLKGTNPKVQSAALHMIWKANRNDIASRADLLPLLSSSRLDNIRMALNLIERSTRSDPGSGANPIVGQRNVGRSLTVAEAIPLVTNRFGEARLIGLRTLGQYGDAKAIELILPRLRDTNPIVRARAFVTIKRMTGESISDSDPAKWEAWWKTNEIIRTQAAEGRPRQ